MSETESSENIIGLKKDKKLSFTDFAKATYDTVKLFRERGRSSPNFVSFPIMTGLMAAFPEKLNYDSLVKSDDVRILCAATYVGVLMNDLIDMQSFLRDREGGKEKLSQIEHQWEQALDDIGFKGNLSSEKRGIIKSYLAGITLVNAIAEADDDKSLVRTQHYKELENAISLVHNSALLLGKGGLEKECFELEAAISLEDLESKYGWLIDGKPTNEIQRRFCGMFNIVMMTQLVDDEFDYEDDKRLGLNTLCTASIQEANGDLLLAKKIREKLKQGYFRRAGGFGVTPLAFKGNEIFIKFAKGLQRRFIGRLGGMREKELRQTVVS